MEMVTGTNEYSKVLVQVNKRNYELFYEEYKYRHLFSRVSI